MTDLGASPHILSPSRNDGVGTHYKSDRTTRSPPLTVQGRSAWNLYSSSTNRSTRAVTCVDIHATVAPSIDAFQNHPSVRPGPGPSVDPYCPTSCYGTTRPPRPRHVGGVSASVHFVASSNRSRHKVPSSSQPPDGPVPGGSALGLSLSSVDPSPLSCSPLDAGVLLGRTPLPPFPLVEWVWR